MVSKITLTELDGIDSADAAKSLQITMGAAVTNTIKTLPVAEEVDWGEWLDAINGVDADSLVDLYFSSSVNPRKLNKELHTHGVENITVSHATRVLAFVDAALGLNDIEYDGDVEKTLLNGVGLCSNIMDAADVGGACEASSTCNQAALAEDHTPGWDGTGKQIEVCADHYQGLQKDDMPIDEKHYQTEPGFPRVEGVDEVQAHRSGGMAEVAHLRQTKEELRDKGIL